MNYLLTEEQRMLQDMVQSFAKEKVKPIARENDHSGEYPTELIKEMAELGLLGIPCSEEYGGAGADNVSYMLAMEAISRHCASTGVVMSVQTSLVENPIEHYGTDEQKKNYLPVLCSGEKIGCYCLTEPQAGSDAGSLKTTAVLKGDKWVLNGTKQFITNAVQAQVAIVFAVTDPGAGSKGISCFIVDRDSPGYMVGKSEEKLGLHASSTAEIIFEDCTIPKENLLGELGQGFKIALSTLDSGRIGIASQALGIAKGSLEEAIAYSKDRIQFGVPISTFQGLKWYIADMTTEYEAAWLLTYRAALMKDKGLRFTREASMAKLKASEVAEFCASKSIQIHGGYGYTRDYDPERYFRDSKITQIYEGTSEIQKEVISAYMLK